ncbi:unnamed protein product, partial [Meganyctiphanes norvegica]
PCYRCRSKLKAKDSYWCIDINCYEAPYSIGEFCSKCRSFRQQKECTCYYTHEKCIMPFIYKGSKRENCIIKDSNRLWCPTKVDENGATDRSSIAYCDKRIC